MTPAQESGHGTRHVPVLGPEAVQALVTKADGVYVDATFGRGGHSRLVLERLGPRGRLLAFDRDPEAVADAARIADGRLLCRRGRISDLATSLDALGVGQVVPL